MRQSPVCQPIFSLFWHLQGLRTPARLPQAVQKFLQENAITYREPQQGLLEVLL